MALKCELGDCQYNKNGICDKDIVTIGRSNQCVDFRRIEKPYEPEYMRIVKFTGYAIIPPYCNEADVALTIAASSGRYNGIIRHVQTEERVTDWEYCENDDHPLNKVDAPIEIHEKYFTEPNDNES